MSRTIHRTVGTNVQAGLYQAERRTDTCRRLARTFHFTVCSIQATNNEPRATGKEQGATVLAGAPRVACGNDRKTDNTGLRRTHEPRPWPGGRKHTSRRRDGRRTANATSGGEEEYGDAVCAWGWCYPGMSFFSTDRLGNRVADG